MAPAAGLPTTPHVTALLALPLTVAWNCFLAPGVTLAPTGETETATAEATLRASAEDTAPGPGLATAMLADPSCVAVPVAVSFTDETNAVASGAPFHSTRAPLTNPFPPTVRLKAPG